MNTRNLPFQLGSHFFLFACLGIACGDDANTLGSFGSDVDAATGTAGSIVTATGSGGTANASGSGGSQSGTAGAAGSSMAGGSGGGAPAPHDAGAGCPGSAPKVGDPCSPAGLSCEYGGGSCCGEGYACTSGTWQRIAALCPCAAPPPDGGVVCGGKTCAADQTCCGPIECGFCISKLSGANCPNICPAMSCTVQGDCKSKVLNMQSKLAAAEACSPGSASQCQGRLEGPCGCNVAVNDVNSPAALCYLQALADFKPCVATLCGGISCKAATGECLASAAPAGPMCN